MIELPQATPTEHYSIIEENDVYIGKFNHKYILQQQAILAYPSSIVCIILHNCSGSPSSSDVTSVISTRRVSRESLVEFRDAQFVIVDRDGLPAFALPEPGKRRSDRSKRKKVMKTRKQRQRNKLSRVKPTSGPMFTGEKN